MSDDQWKHQAVESPYDLGWGDHLYGYYKKGFNPRRRRSCIYLQTSPSRRQMPFFVLHATASKSVHTSSSPTPAPSTSAPCSFNKRHVSAMPAPCCSFNKSHTNATELHCAHQLKGLWKPRHGTRHGVRLWQPFK